MFRKKYEIFKKRNNVFFRFMYWKCRARIEFSIDGDLVVAEDVLDVVLLN